MAFRRTLIAATILCALGVIIAATIGVLGIQNIEKPQQSTKIIPVTPVTKTIQRSPTQSLFTNTRPSPTKISVTLSSTKTSVAPSPTKTLVAATLTSIPEITPTAISTPTFIYKTPSPSKPQPDYQIIQEGVGIGNIVVDKSTVEDVIENYGKQYREINHNEYSIEIIYDPIGLSFYHFLNSTRIFSIKIYPPFKGMTTKGIILGKNTMQDVITLYGPPTWRTTEGGETWWSEYPGIEFHVEKNKALPEFPLNESQHLFLNIIRIDITSKVSSQ